MNRIVLAIWLLATQVECFTPMSMGLRTFATRSFAKVTGNTYLQIKLDLKTLIKDKNCGPLMIRLSWHDAGVFSNGALKGGCPNAALRFKETGEGAFGANAGLPTNALDLLQPITERYVPGEISHADLWALAANVGIEVMGGPKVPTRFGREDAKSAAESVESQVGRLPDGDKGASHLFDVFYPKGFDDKAIVALSGAHSVGACHADRSGFDGQWTEDKYKFDNTYFTEMVAKAYTATTVEATGNPQYAANKGNTIMLESDLALLNQPFREYVDEFAGSQGAFFACFAENWQKLQELGVADKLRDRL